MIKIRKEVKVGLFAFITLAALYWGVNFLRGQDLFRRNITYYAVYDQVSGMQKNSAIKVRGFKIGVVSDIIFEPEKSDQILVELSIKSRYKIPEDSKARISSDGFVSGKAIEMELGQSDRYLKDNDTIQSVQDKNFLEMAGSELEYFKQKTNALVNDISATLQSLTNILSDNSDNIGITMSNLAGITSAMNEVVHGEKSSIRDIVNNMNSLSTSLKNNSERIDNIVANVEVFSDSLRRADITKMIGHLAGTLEEMNVALEGINKGEGTIAKFLSDEKLYDSLVMASGNLARLLDDMRVHPERYINISVFGKKK